MSDRPAPAVSIVMPCLDEADAVGGCVTTAREALRALGVDGEVLVVDNGSGDGSADIAAGAGARVVHEERRGYGAAYLRGFREARGRVLVMGDADASYDFGDIGRFIEPLARGECDLVMGSRLKGRILPGAMSWSHRWIGNPVLSGMLRLLFGTRLSDSHCGMRSFTREAYDRMQLRTSGMEFASEMVVAALAAGLRIREIPISYYPRRGTSKLLGLRDAWRHVRFMLMFSPFYLFQLPGLLLMALGTALILALAGGPRAFFGRTWDYHVVMLGALMVILGYNLVLFDVLAKAFSLGAGFAVRRPWWGRLGQHFRLEHGLLVGGIAFVLGLGIEVKIALDWARAGYGELGAVRGITIGLTAMVLGLQTVFASFLLSLMLLQRREP